MTCFSIQKNFAVALCLGFLAVFATSPSRAQEAVEAGKPVAQSNAPIVIELFTTTDCTSCVFADRILYDSMKNKNVIALSCRTKDISDVEKIEGGRAEGTGRAEYSGPMDPCVFRQWAYRGGRRSDVTISLPLFVLNGSEQIDATEADQFARTLESYKYTANNKTLDIFMKWKDADTISIHLPQALEKSTWRSASLWLMRYKDIEIEKVNDGVNKGRVLRFSNVIQNSLHIGKWHGQTRTIDVDVPKPQGGKESGGYVILAQPMMGETILAAGNLNDYTQTNNKAVAPVEAVPANPN